MGTRTTLAERIIDRLTTQEAQLVCMWGGSPDFTTVRNATIMKGWLYQNLNSHDVKDAIIRLVTEQCK